MFRAIADGRVKAIWIMATNPVDSMPEADTVRAALRACPFVVVSDASSRTDTLAEAHVRLPAAGWGEKDGTVTNSERRISRQRPFAKAPGGARPDWWIVSQVATRMGFGKAFDFSGPSEIFAEHAALSGFENQGQRDFDLRGLIGKDYETLAPTQWPVRQHGTERMFGDGKFFTADQRANFVTVLPPPPFRPDPGRFILNTGRVRDHWHTMTRTGKAARLSAHMAEPFVEIHPADAAAHSIRPATLVRLENQHGTARVRALISARQRRGHVFVPMHWTDKFASNARVDALVPAKVDPVSGQPALKMGTASIEPLHMAMYGFFVARARPELADLDYWAIAEAPGGVRGELGFAAEPDDWSGWVRDRFAVPEGADMATALDARSGRRGYTLVERGRLHFAFFLSPDPVLVSRQWVVEQLSAKAANAVALLAGRPGLDVPEAGAIVCACLSVGMLTIADAVRSHGCTTVEAVGARTGAGSNCGSCRAEIRAIIGTNLATAAR
jgi:assimilatory nitrate reductase catalytic subunit